MALILSLIIKPSLELFHFTNLLHEPWALTIARVGHSCISTLYTILSVNSLDAHHPASFMAATFSTSMNAEQMSHSPQCSDLALISLGNNKNEATPPLPSTAAQYRHRWSPVFMVPWLIYPEQQISYWEIRGCLLIRKDQVKAGYILLCIAGNQ